MMHRLVSTVLFISIMLFAGSANSKGNEDAFSDPLLASTESTSSFVHTSSEATFLSQVETTNIKPVVNAISVLIVPEDFRSNSRGRALGAIGIVLRDDDRVYSVLTRRHVIDSCINRITESVSCNIIEVTRGGFPRIDPDVTVGESVLTADHRPSDIAIIEFLGEFFNRESTRISRIGSDPNSYIAVSGYLEGDRIQSLISLVVDQNYYQNNNCTGASSLPNSENLVYVLTDINEAFQPGFSGGPIILESGDIIGVHGAQTVSDNWPCSSFGFGADYDLIASDPEVRKVLKIIERTFNWIQPLRLDALDKQ